MNKRQAKKARKKVTYPLVDEMNLLTLSAEEYRVAMADFEKFVQKNCRYKHYKDRYKKSGFGLYHFPVGKGYAEKFIRSVLKNARKFNGNVVVQENDALMETQLTRYR